MPSLSPLLWVAEQNVKIPADTHILSYRVQLTAANTTQTINIPTTQTNPAQVVFPGVAPTGEPQTGRRMFITKIAIRDANGTVGGTAGGSITVQDTTTATPVATSGAITTTAPYYIFTTANGTGVVNPNDSLAVIYTAPTSGTATATGFTLDVFGYFQQGI